MCSYRYTFLFCHESFYFSSLAFCTIWLTVFLSLYVYFLSWIILFFKSCILHYMTNCLIITESLTTILFNVLQPVIRTSLWCVTCNTPGTCWYNDIFVIFICCIIYSITTCSIETWRHSFMFQMFFSSMTNSWLGVLVYIIHTCMTFHSLLLTHHNRWQAHNNIHKYWYQIVW